MSLLIKNGTVVTATDRYRHILADYQLLAREQLVCGTQVHVSIDDRIRTLATEIVGNETNPVLAARKVYFDEMILGS